MVLYILRHYKLKKKNVSLDDCSIAYRYQLTIKCYELPINGSHIYTRHTVYTHSTCSPQTCIQPDSIMHTLDNKCCCHHAIECLACSNSVPCHHTDSVSHSMHQRQSCDSPNELQVCRSTECHHCAIDGDLTCRQK